MNQFKASFEKTYLKYSRALSLGQVSLAKDLAFIYNEQLRSYGGPKVFTKWTYLKMGLVKKSDLVKLINRRKMN